MTRRLLSRKYYANVVNVPKLNAINPLKTIIFIMRPIAAKRIFHLSNEIFIVCFVLIYAKNVYVNVDDQIYKILPPYWVCFPFPMVDNPVHLYCKLLIVSHPSEAEITADYYWCRVPSSANFIFVVKNID